MKKIKNILLATASIAVLGSIYSCNANSNDALYQRWQATEINNPLADETYKEQLNYIDTLTVLEEGMAEYFGTDDIEEIKKSLYEEIETDKELMALSPKLTSLEFLKGDKIVFHSYPEGNDTANFVYNKDTKTISVSSPEQPSETLDFKIEKIDNNNLVLILEFEELASTMKMRPYVDSDKEEAEKALEVIMQSMHMPTEMDFEDFDFSELDFEGAE